MHAFATAAVLATLISSAQAISYLGCFSSYNTPTPGHAFKLYNKNAMQCAEACVAQFPESSYSSWNQAVEMCECNSSPPTSDNTVTSHTPWGGCQDTDLAVYVVPSRYIFDSCFPADIQSGETTWQASPGDCMSSCQPTDKTMSMIPVGPYGSNKYSGWMCTCDPVLPNDNITSCGLGIGSLYTNPLATQRRSVRFDLDARAEAMAGQ